MSFLYQPHGAVKSHLLALGCLSQKTVTCKQNPPFVAGIDQTLAILQTQHLIYPAIKVSSFHEWTRGLNCHDAHRLNLLNQARLVGMPTLQ